MSIQTKHPISVKLVEKFTIDGMCLPLWPCEHTNCTIVLSDGRERTVWLNGIKINALIHKIAKEKIINFHGEDHFRKFDELSAKFDVDELLSKIFKFICTPER